MAQDEIRVGELVAPQQIGWLPHATIPQMAARKPSTASGIMSFAQGFNRWLAQNNQWAVNDGYMDAVNGTIQEAPWYQRQGYKNGVNQHTYEQKRLGFVNQAHGLSKLNAIGQITDEEYEEQIRAGARELSDYAVNNLQGEARAQAQNNVLTAYTLAAKNRSETLEKQSYINASETSITAAATASDQLVTAQSVETFAQAMPTILSEVRNASWTAQMNTPDGYKNADKEASMAVASTVRTYLQTLNPANPADVQKAQLLSVYVANTDNMTPEVRNQTLDHLEKTFDKVRDVNAFNDELSNTQVDLNISAGLLENVPEGYFDSRIAEIKKNVYSGMVDPAHGRSQINKLEAQKRAYEAVVEKRLSKEDKQLLLTGDPEQISAANGITYDKAVKAQADELEVKITQSSGGDSFAAASTMMQYGVDKRNNELVDRGVKRLAGVFGSLLHATPEELANSDKRTSTAFQSYTRTMVQAAQQNNRGALDVLEKALPEEYRVAYRQLARNQPHILSDMRQAIPALNRERERLERIDKNPAAQNIVFKGTEFDSSLMNSDTGRANFGYAASEAIRGQMAGNLTSAYRQNVLAFDNVYDNATAKDAMYRAGYALQAKNGMFPSNPDFKENFFQQAGISNSHTQALEETVWKLGEQVAKENNTKVDNNIFVISNDRLSVTVHDDKRGSNMRTFTIGEVADAYKRFNIGKTVTSARPNEAGSIGAYNPSSPYQTPKAPSGGRGDMATWAAYQQMQRSGGSSGSPQNAPKAAPKQTSKSAQKGAVSRSLGLAQAANQSPAPANTQGVQTQVSQSQQQNRDTGRKAIIQQELTNERKAQAQARLSLSMAKSAKNSANIAKYQRAVDDREQNIRALTNELSRMK